MCRGSFRSCCTLAWRGSSLPALMGGCHLVHSRTMPQASWLCSNCHTIQGPCSITTIYLCSTCSNNQPACKSRTTLLTPGALTSGNASNASRPPASITSRQVPGLVAPLLLLPPQLPGLMALLPVQLPLDLLWQLQQLACLPAAPAVHGNRSFPTCKSKLRRLCSPLEQPHSRFVCKEPSALQPKSAALQRKLASRW